MPQKKNTPKIQRNSHVLDATDQTLGRLATRVATLLMGKHKPSYERHKDEGDVVVITNLNHARFTGKKLQNKIIYRHTNYPGGLKEKQLQTAWSEKPDEVFSKTVYRMLPKNKLRKQMMKRLRFEKSAN